MEKTASTRLLKGPSEEEFTNQVLQFRMMCGWRRAHFRPAKTERGWRTPVSGDGKEFRTWSSCEHRG